MAKVAGLDRLRRKLAVLPDAAKDEIRKALVAGAEEIVALAKSLVPVESGGLRNSIGWTWGDAPKGSIALASAGTGDLRITVYAGNDHAYYARWVEFGTVKMAAKPYFFPAYRSLRRRVRSRITRGVKGAVKRVASGS
ncbi:HK97-gp10 family putative phage morphogenesis protein [Chelatococcus sp. GCM10030263]|uniref:HK97-gp10 family putative phage morphogenesis protein n=1 Tax=Chelatococcus sp. GCM10030263 TaxID=3273387 RepID=UPI00360747D9